MSDKTIPEHAAEAVHAILRPYVEDLTVASVNKALEHLIDDVPKEERIEEMFTLKECTRLTKVSRDTLLKMIRDQQLRAVKVRYQWRIPQSEIERVMKGEEA